MCATEKEIALSCREIVGPMRLRDLPQKDAVAFLTDLRALK
jgi:hypothetical protein